MKKQEVPLLDCPKDFLIGDASGKILNEYARFPCKIMCGVYALIVKGTAKATINITSYEFAENDMIYFEPGTFLLIHKFSEDALVYYIIFSHDFSQKNSVQRTLTDKKGMISKNAVIHVPAEKADVLKNMVSVLIQASNCTPSMLTSDIMASVFNVFQVSYNTYLLDHKQFSLHPQDRKELQEYEFATRSEDPLILQSYLDTYKDAPQAHIDAITAHLQQIKQNDLDWNNAYISNSKSMLTEYLLKHPDSPHKALAQQKIDSLDWAQASGLNTIEAYQAYLDEHQDGEHYNEAEENMKALKVKEVTPEEKSMINQLFRRFFISINERNQDNLVSTVAEELTLLDKEQATPRDEVQMMEKMYKDDVTHLIWRINKDYSISKREVGDNRYEYSVSFTALKEEEHTDAANNKNSQYRINAKVNPNNRISELKMSKIVD